MQEITGVYWLCRTICKRLQEFTDFVESPEFTDYITEYQNLLADRQSNTLQNILENTDNILENTDNILENTDNILENTDKS